MVAVADREQLDGQVFPVVDFPVHGHKSLQTGFVFHVGVVETRVEHDDGKRQDVACVCYAQKNNTEKPQLVSRRRADVLSLPSVYCDQRGGNVGS